MVIVAKSARCISRARRKTTPLSIDRSTENFSSKTFSPFRSVCGTIAAIDMAPEIVTNAITAALSTGAVAGATDTAKSAIADGYQGLKSLIKKKFGDHSGVAKAIDNLEEKPDSGVRRQMVLEEPQAINSTSDPELVSAAQSVFKLIQALLQGEKHIQISQGTSIAQADRGSTATVNISAPPRKDD
jgi:hypothetical protein